MQDPCATINHGVVSHSMGSDSQPDSNPTERPQTDGIGEGRSRFPLELGRDALADVFARNRPKAELKRLLIVYATIGITLGIAGYFVTEMFAGAAEAGADDPLTEEIAIETFGSLIHLVALVVFGLLGPLIAVILFQGLPGRLPNEPNRTVYLIGFIGGYVGHIGLILSGFFILSQHRIIAPGGETGGGLFGGAFLIALASAIAGVSAIYIAKTYGEVPTPVSPSQSVD